jgi:hypothetical protein
MELDARVCAARRAAAHAPCGDVPSVLPYLHRLLLHGALTARIVRRARCVRLGARPAPWCAPARSARVARVGRCTRGRARPRGGRVRLRSARALFALGATAGIAPSGMET